MQIHQLRNATLMITLGEHRLLVDPMLSEPGAMAGFKIFGGGRRNNPLVALPSNTKAALDTVTAVLITHEHPDHFDGPGRQWVTERNLPVWTNGVDAPNLRRKGLDVHELRDGVLGMGVEIIRSRHGRGVLGWLMGPVAGYYLAYPGEPSLYLTGDSVLTDSVMEAIERLAPDVIIAPAGAANMGLGGDILFSVDELLQIIRKAPGKVVLNHLEALDHCPTTREDLRKRLAKEGLLDRVFVPDDGERLDFDAHSNTRTRKLKSSIGEKPGVQKWMTAPFA